ncbi:MAG: aminopeptidase [Clostridiales bacterium]|nr:aminopeptidase [Clostridiales bacterium]
MFDPRIIELACGLVNFSVALQPGENILIENIGGCDDLTRAIIKEVYRVGGKPFLWIGDKAMDRELWMHCTPEQLQIRAGVDAALMGQMQAYIGVRGGANSSETSDVPSDRMNDYMTHYWNPVHGDIRVKKTRWCVLRYPSPGMAQQAGQSTEAFEDFYFKVCNLDYSKMDRAMDAMAALLANTDRVRIVGPADTDLSFSIKGIPSEKCAGQKNIPDGEIYTAPVRDSVNGVIHYNTPSLESGFTYEDIRFEFKDGKIIHATANDTARINEMLDIDEGARYVGEFAIGVNPYINVPMKDTLFDEKIAGSIHFTPGRAYDEADNGNRSAKHWDLVLIQTPEYGGGEIYFDGILIRKDGRFVLPELFDLNPENLV